MAAPQRPGPVQISAALKSAKDQISSKPGFIIASYDGPRSINLLHRGDDIRDLPRRVVPEQILWISLRLDTEVGSRRVFVGYFGPRYTGPIPLVRHLEEYNEYQRDGEKIHTLISLD